jgi:hypothetical protein
MRPGWLISIFLFSGIVCSSLWAETPAPSYLIVPPPKHSLQSAESKGKIEQLAENGDHIMVAGNSPTFTLEFADVRDQSGSGFDDPLQGAQRRAVAASVFERVSLILDGEPGSAKIVFDSRSPWLNQNTLAIGIPFFQCIDGFQKPIAHQALKTDEHVHTHEGELLVNFDLPLSASPEAPPDGKYDLYTVLFHEMIHILGFVGFTVEADGNPQDCGGARMMPAIAGFTTDSAGKALWKEEGGEISYIGTALDLPSSQEPVLLEIPHAQTPELRLATSNLRVSGHWLPLDFSERTGVLMLREPFPTGEIRRNLTPETKSILRDVLEYEVSEEKRGLTGSWVDIQLNGQGFTLHFISESRFVIYYFGFTDSGEKLWLVGGRDGGFELGEAITVPLYEASGGQFSHFQIADISELLWGELQIRFLDCWNATATLSGLDGVQQMSLFPLARVDSLDCF